MFAKEILILVVLYLIQGIVAPPGGGGTKVCRSCHNVHHPEDCNVFEVCHEELCGTQVHYLNGNYSFTFKCMGHHDLPGFLPVLTSVHCKRLTAFPHATVVGDVEQYKENNNGMGHTTQSKIDCCKTNLKCEKVPVPGGKSVTGKFYCEECDAHLDPVAIGKRGRGHHHEEGQLVCQQCCDHTGCDRDLCSPYHLQTTAAPAPVTTKLPMTTAAPATTVIQNKCRNHESTEFKCTELDSYNFCTDTTSVAYLIAHEKCPLHCGFCDPLNPDATITLPKTTVAPPTTTTATDVMVTDEVALNMTDEPIGATVTLCIDLGDSNFSCDDWLSFGFCSPTSGVGYEVARLRCQKTCGFCT